MCNRPLARRLIPPATFLVSVIAAPVFAQSAVAPESAPAFKKWDATGTVGWYHHRIATGVYDVPVNSMFAGATLGRYWTEHVKTEVEIGTGGRSDNTYYWDPSFPTGLYAAPATQQLSDVQVSAAQFYQFFHNAWFHPFLGAGLVYQREDHSAMRPAQEVPTYAPGTGTPTGWFSLPAWSRQWTQSHVAPFVLGGCKAYVSRRAFFRADLRVTGDTWHSVNTRIGFGFDF